MTPRQRLEHLADELERYEEELEPHFDMEVWSQRLHVDSTLEDLLHGCGTAACAAGFACLLPALKADGLYLYGGKVPGFGHNTASTEALRQFFGIDFRQMNYIFMDQCYIPDQDSPYFRKVSPKEVVAHIREVLKEMP